jgi:anti-anti-sigma factor
MAATLLSPSAPSSDPEGAVRIPRIEVAVTETPGEVVVRVAGKGCVGQAEALAAGLLRLSARRPSRITLDLGGLNCVSSLTMGVLVSFRQGVVRAGGQVSLAASLREPVREALERAGLLALFGWTSGRELAPRVAS